MIEEEGEEFRPFGRGPQPVGGMGQMTPPAIMARVLFDFEAADDDELTVESEYYHPLMNDPVLTWARLQQREPWSPSLNPTTDKVGSKSVPDSQTVH